MIGPQGVGRMAPKTEGSVQPFLSSPAPLKKARLVSAVFLWESAFPLREEKILQLAFTAFHQPGDDGK